MQKTMQCWPLFGKGLDQLGRNHEPCVWDLPQPGPEELLVRIDAIGLCFSDVKLIRAGEDHPRVFSKDLATNPVIPGHEAVMTVVAAGDEVKADFAIGSRYIVQADIYVHGVNVAYGYAINGGMAQYSLIDQRILDGDEGCYLLPLQESVPAALAALIEPWTCVIASYMIEHRATPLAGGRMLIVMEPGHEDVYDFLSADIDHEPAEIDCLQVNAATLKALKSAFPGARFTSCREIPCSVPYDDVVLCGVRNPDISQVVAKLGASNAVISFVGAVPESAPQFDVGSIHYKGWFYQGTAGNDISAAYGRNVRSGLKPGGTCWLAGGAGAMGQMHTQLAVENPDGPARILVTDLDNGRIAKLTALLQGAVKARGIEFKTLNPRDFASESAYFDAVRAFAPNGFDDIVMLVPVPAVVESSVPFLGTDGLMNIFAGIPAGKEARLNAADMMNKGTRYIGSSGSRTAHLRHTLGLVESGKLNPATALAAVGGMRSLWDGIHGVAEAQFPGKTVIFPNCEQLPLTAIEELPKLIPGIETTFAPGGLFTSATEQAIFAKFGPPS